LQPVPRPRLDTLGGGVVHADGHVHVLWLVAGHVLLELFVGVGDDREVLGRDAVALRAVAVAPEGDPPPPGLTCREHDAARDAGGEVLLEDTAVHDLANQGSHALLRALNWALVGWSDHKSATHDVGLSSRSPVPLADAPKEVGQGAAEEVRLLEIRQVGRGLEYHQLRSFDPLVEHPRRSDWRSRILLADDDEGGELDRADPVGQVEPGDRPAAADVTGRLRPPDHRPHPLDDLGLSLPERRGEPPPAGRTRQRPASAFPCGSHISGRAARGWLSVTTGAPAGPSSA